MARNTRNRFWRAAPALHLKAQTAKRLGGCTAEVTEFHDADGDFTGNRLVMVAPEPLALLGLIETLAAMNEQYVQHDVFDHAGGQIGIDNSHDRNGRKRRVAKEVIDTGAQREDGLQVCELGQRPRGRAPRTCIGNFASPFDLVWPDPDRSRRSESAKALSPSLGIPTADHDCDRTGVRI